MAQAGGAGYGAWYCAWCRATGRPAAAQRRHNADTDANTDEGTRQPSSRDAPRLVRRAATGDHDEPDDRHENAEHEKAAVLAVGEALAVHPDEPEDGGCAAAERDERREHPAPLTPPSRSATEVLYNRTHAFHGSMPACATMRMRAIELRTESATPMSRPSSTLSPFVAPKIARSAASAPLCNVRNSQPLTR